MKVALVHDWLTGFRGGEKCLEVACREFPDAKLLTLLRNPGSTSPSIERMDIQSSLLQWLPGVANYYRYCLPLMPLAASRMKTPVDADLVLSFSHAVAKGVTVPAGIPHISYCFTPMRYAWQLRNHYFPENHSSGLNLRKILRSTKHFARDKILDRIRHWDRETSKQVTHFVAISQTIAQRIWDCYQRPSVVIYPPVNTEFYLPSFVPREDFYLCVSALTPYKRIDLAVKACRKLGRRLIVIGSGPRFERLKNQADENIQFLGWRSDEEIRDHMRRCRALLFPGLEDFGIVPLEAQACGTPVIAFGQGGATETIIPGSSENIGTGAFFQEQTANALKETIKQFEENPGWFSAALCRKNAEKFNTERFRNELLTYIQQVISGQTEGSRDPVETTEFQRKAG